VVIYKNIKFSKLNQAFSLHNYSYVTDTSHARHAE